MVSWVPSAKHSLSFSYFLTHTQSHFPNTHFPYTGSRTMWQLQTEWNWCLCWAAGRQVFHCKPPHCTQSLKLPGSTVCCLSTPFVRHIPENNNYPECTTSQLERIHCRLPSCGFIFTPLNRCNCNWTAPVGPPVQIIFIIQYFFCFFNTN